MQPDEEDDVIKERRRESSSRGLTPSDAIERALVAFEGVPGFRTEDQGNGNRELEVAHDAPRAAAETALRVLVEVFGVAEPGVRLIRV